MARLALPALAAAVLLVGVLAAPAHARKYDQEIHARQHTYDAARGKYAHARGHAARRHARYRMRRALRAKRYWQHRQRVLYHPPFVLPLRVVLCESGGDWQAVNRTPAGAANGYPGGAYQITRPTWALFGGREFAPTAENATPRQQGIVALRVLHGQGQRAWECWT